MGVTGLWKLIDAAGKPVPVESLENKVLAVDVSIWLHQLVKGFQDSGGKTLLNAHLLGLFHRICKLLFFRIKPVFVFDGGVPSLKKKTIIARQNIRNRASQSSSKARLDLLKNLVKQQVLGKALGERVTIPKMKASSEDTMFYLPPLPKDSVITKTLEEDSDSDSEGYYDGENMSKYGDIHSIDVTSADFLSLPADMRHSILTELKGTRKQNSWAKLHEMPEDVGQFSNFQMKRLLNRRSVQVGLEKAEEEMGGKVFSLAEIKTMMTEQGVDLTQRIASDNVTRFIYASGKDLKIGVSDCEPPRIAEEIFIKRDQEERNLSDDEEVYDDMACITPLMDNSGLSQQEIFDLIKEQNRRGTSQVTRPKFDENQPSTSKAAMEFMPAIHEEEEEDTSPGKYVNDPVVHRENHRVNNDARKVEHGMVPRGGLVQTSPARLFPVPPSLLKTDSELYELPYSEGPSCSNAYGHSESVKLSLDDSFDDSWNDEDFSEVNDGFKCGNSVDKTKEKYKEKKLVSFAEVLAVYQPKPSAEAIKNVPKQIASISPIKKSEPDKKDVSSSDDDDFLEVADEAGLEIVVKTRDTITEEEDLFADVFKRPAEETLDSEVKEKVPELESEGYDVTVEMLSSGDDSETQSSALEDNSLQSSESSPVKTPRSSPSKTPQLTTEEMQELKKNLEVEGSELLKQQAREERLASSISEQFTLEAQELLRLFGVPYLVAPMEAEAQCAYLDIAGQTQGTISDDSDIWLFGGQNVYKNFFDQKKFVLQFKASDIERCYKLQRQDMVLLALLTGSDYTTGLQGVGPVTAIEVLACFPEMAEDAVPEQRLERFTKCYQAGTLKESLAKKLRRLKLIHGFPSGDVVKAYLEPCVNQDKEPFSWAVPDLSQLRQYTRDKFGWDQKRADTTLIPIIDKIKQSTTQKTLHGYFEWATESFQAKMSKRVEQAVRSLGGLISDDSPSPPRASKNLNPRKKRKSKSVAEPNLSESSDSCTEEPVPVKKNKGAPKTNNTAGKLRNKLADGIAKQNTAEPKTEQSKPAISPTAQDARLRAAKVLAKYKEEELTKKKKKVNK